MTRTFRVAREFLRGLRKASLESKARTCISHHHQFVQFMDRYAPSGDGSRILELGCGEHYPNTLLFHQAGYFSVGIDLDLNIAGKQRNRRSPRKLLWRVYRRRLHRELALLLGRGGRMDTPRLIEASASALPFRTHSFNAAVSMAVWEHIMDIRSATREVHRVLKPGGLLVAGIHLYTSLSGAHGLVSADKGPWYHLRNPESVRGDHLNKHRMHEYEMVFDRFFERLEVIKEPEGEEVLTPEIREELSRYSREELSTLSLLFVGRKKA